MKKNLPIVILLGCVAAFVFGVVQLFQLRFEAGDVYPPYSSLRADPLGAMAFYESLEKIPGLFVRRDFSASNVLPEEPDTVYLHLAGSRYGWDWVPKDLFREIEAFLGRGGRLVITFFPQNEPEIFHLDDEEQTNSVNSAKSKDKKMTPEKPARKKEKLDEDEYAVQLDERWGFHTDLRKLTAADGVYQPAQVTNQTELPLPRTLDWHSGIVFTNLDPAWRVIYARGTDAVVIERKFGLGSVVIATDSYFVSNEAMAMDRHADLLAWLIGANKNVVFDEAHFGIMERSGVAVLMRKYRLHGLVAGLVLLAGLFIWKNSTSLVPPHAEEKRENVIAGKDASSGFVNLLRRNIPRRAVLATCFAEWKKSVAQKGKVSAARLQQAEAIFSAENSLPGKDRNPIQTYRTISETLGTRNKNYEH
jgi:Domain of unknown function (DUF4350)